MVRPSGDQATAAAPAARRRAAAPSSGTSQRTVVDEPGAAAGTSTASPAGDQSEAGDRKSSSRSCVEPTRGAGSPREASGTGRPTRTGAPGPAAGSPGSSRWGANPGS